LIYSKAQQYLLGVFCRKEITVIDLTYLEAGQVIDKLRQTYLFYLFGSSFFQSRFTTILLVLVLLTFIFFLLYRFYLVFKALNESRVLIELTPPLITEKSSYTTERLFLLLHELGNQRSFLDTLIGLNTHFSLEIVSTRSAGIRYLINTPHNKADNLKRFLISYLPQVKITITDDYLNKNTLNASKYWKVISFKQNGNPFLPLNQEKYLEEHDPVAYITGLMTKLLPDELILLQIVTTPTSLPEVAHLKQQVLKNEDILKSLQKSQASLVFRPIIWLFLLFARIVKLLFDALFEVITELYHSSRYQNDKLLLSPDILKQHTYNTFEQQLVSQVSEKLNQPLFEVSIRVLLVTKTNARFHDRLQGITSSLATFNLPGYQALSPIKGVRRDFLQPILQFELINRLHSILTGSSQTILSSLEIASLFHFPHTQVTQTEGIIKSLSQELPAPLSLKQNKTLDVVFAENSYGGEIVPIGLTKDERKTHMFVLGRTGSGKTTLLYTLARHDIEQGKGLAFIDPHGDVSEELIATIPLDRKHDFVYLNPYDISYPVGINLLELTPGLSDDQSQLEKELVTEGVISLFKKIFSKEENTDSHRIEYILRNTIYTAFTVPDRTIFTIYELLNNPSYRKQVTKELTDDNLKNFWKHEFGKAGSYQVVKMAAGVTAKIGRFLFSPIAKRILEQPKSTINFDEVLNGKILICNLSQGKLGEDTAKLLGTTILTKIQQAAMKRAFIPQKDRKQFHLYVDEFQNFATTAFTKILSEGRKYGLDVIMAEQSVSQQDDPAITNVTLANVTTVVCFRTGNPKDEELMLAQFAPTVKPGDISNLPPYHFYIHISAGQPQLPFSGQTILKPKSANTYQVSQLIQTSRNQYATLYASKPVSSPKKSSQIKSPSRPSKRPLKSQKMSKSLSTLTG